MKNAEFAELAEFSTRPDSAVSAVPVVSAFHTEEVSCDFSPLRFVPKGKHVVLGLVSTKTPLLESKEALKRRIDEAAKYVPLERLGVSPQCGFSSGGGAGQTVTQDDTRRKLELVLELAHDVWGAAA